MKIVMIQRSNSQLAINTASLPINPYPQTTESQIVTLAALEISLKVLMATINKIFQLTPKNYNRQLMFLWFSTW